jgi:hypothetical protein
LKSLDLKVPTPQDYADWYLDVKRFDVKSLDIKR